MFGSECFEQRQARRLYVHRIGVMIELSEMAEETDVTRNVRVTIMAISLSERGFLSSL